MGCINKKSIIEPNHIKYSNNKNEVKQYNSPIDKSNNTKSYNKSFSIIEYQNKQSKLLQSLDRIIVDTKSFIKDSGKLEDSYSILNKLGEGTFGSVYRVIHKLTDQIRAMKTISKSTVNLQDDNRQFLKEIEILIKTDHMNIVKIYEYFLDDLNYYVITEFVSGGDLFESITKWESFNEEKASYIMRQLLSCVSYLHANHIVHRDLKPENLMVEKSNKLKKINENEINIKLIDFGTCNYFDGKSKLTLKVGTPSYMAPEVYRKSYTEKCDLWSCGIILHILLVGYPPFLGDSTEEIILAIMVGKISFDDPEWNHVSSTAKDLLLKMLDYNMESRISAQEALNHNWVRFNVSKSEKTMNQSVVNKVLINMKSFSSKEKIQQAAIAYIVHFQYAADENEELKQIFTKLDKNGDGILSYKELKDGFSSLHKSGMIQALNEAELNKLILDLDQDMNGYIEYGEFLRATINKDLILNENNLKLAFQNFDTNGDGILSKDELKKVLGTTNNTYIQEIIKKVDENGDGNVSFEEFSIMMKNILSTDKKKHKGSFTQNTILASKTCLNFDDIDKNIEEKRI